MPVAPPSVESESGSSKSAQKSSPICVWQKVFTAASSGASTGASAATLESSAVLPESLAVVPESDVEVVPLSEPEEASVPGVLPLSVSESAVASPDGAPESGPPLPEPLSELHPPMPHVMKSPDARNPAMLCVARSARFIDDLMK